LAAGQVRRALDAAQGGSPSASLDEVVAKLARARVGSAITACRPLQLT
jgi:hypothetical protein